MDIDASFITYQDCESRVLNKTIIKTDFEDAVRLSTLDVFFKKYCPKRSNVLVCLNALDLKITPCLEKEEQESLNVMKIVLQSELDFLCQKDGEQIALFFAEKGFECFEPQSKFRQCIKSTFPGFYTSEMPKLVIGQKTCGELLTLKSCILSHLKGCEKATPVNLIESMFTTVGNEPVCRNQGP